MTKCASISLVIIIKTQKEIEAMRIAGKHHAHVLHEVAQLVRPGISTGELDTAAEKLVREMGDIPAFKDYRPKGAKSAFPATLCISINDEVVHGIPSQQRILQEGDIISLDLGVNHQGVFTDAAITVAVGTISKELQDLLSVTHESLMMGIAAAQAGNTTGDIGHAIETFINKRYGIVREFSGHGVGRKIHEDPYVPNYGKPGSGAKLVPGMTIAIEPMLIIGSHHVEILEDDWTVATVNGKHAAHFEHTILITEDGPEILTTK